MVKFVIQFSTPTEQETFEDIYNDFLALVERMPSITRRQVNTVLGSPLGEIAIYRVLEVYFDDYPTMQAALRSPAGQEAGGELGRLPPGAITMYFAEVYEELGSKTEGTG